ncbi:MAG: hypothetical protein HRU33_08060 [Rhodobacteraceae bacterium]|nr:hypothetical protein [Paracoccaceae bacterium]
MSKLAGRAKSMKSSGATPEEIARAMNQARNEIRARFQRFTPRAKRAEIARRNVELYSNPVGPTIGHLRARKSWDEITSDAVRTGGKDLGF